MSGAVELSGLGQVESQSTSSPAAAASTPGEVRYAAGFLEWFAGDAERVYGQIAPSADRGKRVLVLREPVGVAVAVTPWNFPAAMLTRKLGPAIAAGCPTVVKPAERRR